VLRIAARTGRLVGLALLAGALLAPAGAPEEVLVGAAASLAEPMAVIASGYEAAEPGARVRLVLGASNVLAEQLRAGAPLDLLISADPQLVERLAGEGLLAADGRRRIAGNRLVVVVRAELAGRLSGASDLARPEIHRIAVPDAAVPVGRYAREWLERRGLLAELAPRLVATADARATLAAVDSGNADAAVVYATDARLVSSARLAFEIPAVEQPAIAYEAALRAGAGAAARGFFAHLGGAEARRILASAGFAPPPGAP